MKEVKKLIENLKGLLPELEEGRLSHVDWRDCHQKYRDENPDVGDSKFHHEMVLVYDNRIQTVKEAIELLEDGLENETK